LKAELDVVLSRKLRAPMQPELAIGAISEGGEVYLNALSEDVLALNPDYLRHERQHQLIEITRLRELFQRARPPAEVAGRSVIVTDDGITTGSTMIAALQSIRPKNPLELIVAVPIASPARLAEVREWCDVVVCRLASDDGLGVDQFYQEFDPVDDDVVVRVLRKFGVPQLADSPSICQAAACLWKPLGECTCCSDRSIFCYSASETEIVRAQSLRRNRFSLMSARAMIRSHPSVGNQM
jgi:predicted phosphoribosyltransferase